MRSHVPGTCSKAELGILLNVSGRSIDTWVQRGAIVRAERGRYLVAESVSGYCKALRARAEGAEAANNTLTAERIKTAVVVRAIRERELNAMSIGTLTQSETREAWSEFAALVRQAIEALPGRSKAALPNLTDHDLKAIGSMCRDTLMDLVEEAKVAIAANPKELTS